MKHWHDHRGHETLIIFLFINTASKTWNIEYGESIQSVPGDDGRATHARPAAPPEARRQRRRIYFRDVPKSGLLGPSAQVVVEI